MRSKITQALQKLEEQLVGSLDSVVDGILNKEQESNKEAGGEASTEDVTKAKEAIAKGKESLREIS